jgi:WD40 repeat protein
VRVVIAIREDYLTALEELATLIPGILRTRFRLRPLTREEARSAIEDPARVIHRGLGTPGFDFTPGTVDALLDLLAVKPTAAQSGAATIEPFQLQLVCQYVEDLVRQRAASAPRGVANEGKAEPAIKIDFADLGGTQGFHRIIRQFYERQLDEVGQSFRRRSLERLCERGLVNALGKRLSEEENEIARQFGVPRKALLAMAERRLLRAEPRLDSTFYELSHDMLVEPVLAARLERHRKQAKWRWAGIAAAVLVSIGFLLRWMIVERYRHELVQSAAKARELAATDTEKALIIAVAAMGKSLNLGGVSQVSTALSTILNQPTVTPAPLGDRQILASTLAPGGRLVAAATADGRVELRDRGGRLILTLPVGGQGWNPIVAFGPDGDALAVASGARVQAWDVSGRPLTKETTLPEPATALEFSPAGDMLVVATTSKKLCSVDFRAGSSECSTFEGLDGELCQLLFTGSDDRLLGLTREGTVFQWRIAARKFQDLSASFKVTLAPKFPEVSADERHSAAIYGSSVLLWQTGSKELRQLRLTDAEGAVPTAVAFSPAGDKLAVGTDKGRVSIFLTGTGTLDRSFDAKAGRIAAIAWEEGELLAVGGTNGLFFNPGHTRPARDSEAGAPTWDSYKYSVTALAFLPDGSLLSADRTGVRLWGTDGVLRAKRDLRDYRDRGGMVRSLAAVPKGSFFLVGDDDQDLEVWSVDGNGFKTESHRDPPNDILSIHLDARGTRVTTIDSHGEQAEWNLTGSVLSQSRRKVPTKGATDFTDRVTTIESDRAGSILPGRPAERSASTAPRQNLTR